MCCCAELLGRSTHAVERNHAIGEAVLVGILAGHEVAVQALSK